jgi:predicted dehydrogenase
MTSDKISIGIMGSGGFGETARRYLRNTGEFQIVACMDTNNGSVRRAAAEEDAVAYTDAAAFLAHPGLQAVSINTPVPLHADHIRMCMDHGKHVFVTKPVTASVEEARSIAVAAQSRGLVVMVGHHARHRPAIRAIHRAIDEGKIGRLCNVMVASCSSRGLHGDPGEWRFHESRNPGGPLLHCGVHIIDILISVLGPVRRVAAMCQDTITPHRVEDNYMVMLEFRGGVQAMLTSNYTTGYLHTMHWMGSDGNLHLHEHITHLGQCDLFYQRRMEGDCEPWESVVIPSDPSYPDDHAGALEREFANQVRLNQPNYDNLEQAIAVLQVVDAAIRSAKTGRFVMTEHDDSTQTDSRAKLEPVIMAVKTTSRRETSV